jgi:hypothetical protein
MVNYHLKSTLTVAVQDSTLHVPEARAVVPHVKETNAFFLPHAPVALVILIKLAR